MTEAATHRHELRARARAFAESTLGPERNAHASLPTAAERFAATRPHYEALVADGLLRACIPKALGGDSDGLLDAAIVTEELHTGDTGIALTLIGTVLGLQPVLAAGTAEQQ